MIENGKSAEPAGVLRGMRVLIAEDNWLLADTLSVLLEERGARVIGPAPTASAAIRLVATNTIDFALIDMNLKDGFSDGVIEPCASAPSRSPS